MGKTVYIIAGPTASGKSTKAIALAQQHNGVIINADSMQLYSSLSLLTARPRQADLAQCPHKLYGVIDDPNEAQSVAAWRQLAINEIEAAFVGGQVPIVVGGTGLYLKALIEGLSPIPDSDTKIREELRHMAQGVQGREQLYYALQSEDPDSAAKLTPKDTQRIVRALEVVRSTGHTILYWQQKKGDPLPYPVHKILLDPPRDVVVARAEKRLRQMFDHGAIEEVQALLERGIEKSSPLYKAVGVREIEAYLAGVLTRDEAFEKALMATRHYIKRQQTWFRHQMTFDERIQMV